MSAALTTRMEALKAAFAARVPARVVTRDYKESSARVDTDMVKGIYTLISMGEHGFTNVPGYNAMDGTQRVVIIGDIRLGEDAAPHEIEDAEFTMIEEIEGLCRNLPAELCVFNLIAWQQSGQQEAPFGWVSASLEYVP